MAPNSEASIPVVNLSPFFSRGATQSTKESTAKEVAEKCSVNGCLAITGHGIPTEFLNEAFDLAKTLFDLPIEDKMKAPHPAGMVPHRGYSAPGKERTFEKEEFDGSDADHKSMLQATQDWKESYEVGDDANQRDYNIWLPNDTLPDFRPISTTVFLRLRQLSLGILEALIMGMGVTEEESAIIREQHLGPTGQLRFLHYLAMEPNQQLLNKANRLPAHTDWSSFTLSFQDATGGLEFRDRKSDLFMPVVPRKDAVYLNIGDMMERSSNGLYPACTHRVVLPSRDSHTSMDSECKRSIPDRFSLIYFATIVEDVVVAPPASRVEKDGGAKFEPVTYNDYAEERSKWHYVGHKKDQ